MTVADAAGREELISVEAAGQEFAVDVHSVREIRAWTPTTPLPHAPPHIRGVINLRGDIMPVVDLRQLAGLPACEPESRNVIVVVEHGGRTVGLLVDGVRDALQVPPADVKRPPEFGTSEGPVLIDGLISLEQRMIGRLVVSTLVGGAPQVAAAA